MHGQVEVVLRVHVVHAGAIFRHGARPVLSTIESISVVATHHAHGRGLFDDRRLASVGERERRHRCGNAVLSVDHW